MHMPLHSRKYVPDLFSVSCRWQLNAMDHMCMQVTTGPASLQTVTVACVGECIGQCSRNAFKD